MIDLKKHSGIFGARRGDPKTVRMNTPCDAMLRSYLSLARHRLANTFIDYLRFALFEKVSGETYLD